MNFTQRPFLDETDKIRMAELARQFPSDNLHVMDLPYRLSSWALDDPQNARLWFDEARQLAGWAVLQAPFWTIDYACQPAAEASLFPEILAWADGRARQVMGGPHERPAWFVMAFSGQAQRIRQLEAAGFQCQADVGEDSWSKMLLRRPGQAPLRVYRPPAGYTVRPLGGEAEVEGYVELHRAVFESKNMTAEWRGRTLRHPAYRPDLDLVVEAPGGALAAWCIGWFDEAAQTGQIEPLGCHQNFRRYALGRVALSHVLARLQSLGAKHIFVETDNYRNTAYLLYQTFDFQLIEDVWVFRKDFR